MVAGYPSHDQDFETALLDFSPLLDETSQSSSEQFDFLMLTLLNFGKTIAEKVIALIADNCETNKALADLCEVPLIGCSSHRLALAVKELLKPHETLLNKINMIMGKLNSPKMSAELRKLTPLRPIQQGATRWLSTMQMLERYLSIKDHLSKIPGLLELLVSPVEDNEVKELSKTMVPLKSVTLALQRDEMDMASVRLLFDELLGPFQNWMPRTDN